MRDDERDNDLRTSPPTAETAVVPAVMPNRYRRQPTTCLDCTWKHKPERCPMRDGSISRLRREIRERRERLADITGEPS